MYTLPSEMHFNKKAFMQRMPLNVYNFLKHIFNKKHFILSPWFQNDMNAMRFYLYSFWKYWPFYLTTALMVFVISAQKYLKVHPNLRIFSCPTHKLSVKQDEKFRSR